MAVRLTPTSRNQTDNVVNTRMSGSPAEMPMKNIVMTRGSR